MFVAPSLKREAFQMRKGDYIVHPWLKQPHECDITRAALREEMESLGVTYLDSKFEDVKWSDIEVDFVVVSVMCDFYIPLDAWRNLPTNCKGIYLLTHILDEYITHRQA